VQHVNGAKKSIRDAGKSELSCLRVLETRELERAMYVVYVVYVVHTSSVCSSALRMDMARGE
jgi:hypothetical protein